MEMPQSYRGLGRNVEIRKKWTSNWELVVRREYEAEKSTGTEPYNNIAHSNLRLCSNICAVRTAPVFQKAFLPQSTRLLQPSFMQTLNYSQSARKIRKKEEGTIGNKTIMP